MRSALLLALAFVVTVPPAAYAGKTEQEKFIRALDEMMVSLGSESARDSRTIKDGYRSHLDLLVLQEYSAVARALDNGGLAPLPADPLRFNLMPRVSGAAPIGEKDLENQESYISARPATIGALLSVASRVKSGPIEITSLVRHTEYQGALRETNGNATTSVPMHTMGLAFDIALLNTPLERAYEIRDALRQMRDAGDILFIGERQQLVFHVVPHPSRLGYFHDVYARAVTAAWAEDGALVPIPPVPALPPATPPVSATVSADIVEILPHESFAAEWWAAAADQADVVLDVKPASVAVPSSDGWSSSALSSLFGLCSGVVAVFVYRRSKEQDTGCRSLFMNS